MTGEAMSAPPVIALCGTLGDGEPAANIFARDEIGSNE